MTSVYNFKATKALGQNYLKDQNIVRKIVQSVGISPTDSVLEVGPGPGSLTNVLLEKKPRSLILIEKDRQFIPHWQERSHQNTFLKVHHGDALKIPLSSLIDEPLTIVSNLPYNVGTPLLIQWLRQLPLVKSMTLMLQKEVVLRMVAQPGSKDYGRLSILTQWLCTVERLFDVPPTAFQPQPKVMSSIVKLIPREMPLFPASFSALEQMTAVTFQQRRKMLKKSLQTVWKDPMPYLQDLGIDPTARPEVLSIENFCALSRLAANSSNIPL